MSEILIIRESFQFAAEEHGLTGEVRDYTGKPFIVHPVAVAQYVSAVIDDPEVIGAALMHDLVENTRVTLGQIRARFSSRMSLMVDGVTNRTQRGDGTRAERQAIERAHIAQQDEYTKSIKLADVLDNVPPMTLNNPSFAPIYVAEKRALWEESLRDGHPVLVRQVDRMLTQCERVVF